MCVARTLIARAAEAGFFESAAARNKSLRPFLDRRLQLSLSILDAASAGCESLPAIATATHLSPLVVQHMLDAFVGAGLGQVITVNSAPIIIVGNQKAGTSAIAALLAHATNLSVAIDLPNEMGSPSYPDVMLGTMPLSAFVQRNKLRFCRDIIKEPHLTVLCEPLLQHFPQARMVFVVRDPRHNIRSILDRLCIPGTQRTVTTEHVRSLPRGWQLVMDGKWLGLDEETHIGMLAARWQYLTDLYLLHSGRMTLIRYEDFMIDKTAAITTLATQLGLCVTRDIAPVAQVQYQPRGLHRDVCPEEFFGKEHLSIIDALCKNRKHLGYLQ